MTVTSITVWGPLIVAAIITAAMTPLAVWFAPKIGAMDIPKDARRVHNKPMPRFGGAAIYIGMMVSLAVFTLQGRGVVPIMMGCTIVYALGLIDDLMDMKPIIKFAGQVLAATVVFAMGVRITFVKITIIDILFTSGHPILFGSVIDYLVTVLWLVAITNAVNLIDGLDGLAAGIAAISALCIAYVAYIHGYELPTMLMMAVAGSALGFLPFNFHPARIFMGDGGSQLLGFAIAAFSVQGTVKGATIMVVLLPALVLGLPIFDTIMAIIRRTSRHQSISTADKEHLHHKIMKAGFGQRRAVMLMYSLSGIMGIMAVLYSRGLYVECIGLLGIAAMIVGVILTDTGKNNISLKGRRILKEDLGDESRKRRKRRTNAEHDR